MHIELRLLRHAIALGQHRNFARAAEALNLTQPTLSRSIATLEEALGVPLFDRSHKGVTPTPFGRVLLERGEDVVKGESNLRREIAAPRRPGSGFARDRRRPLRQRSLRRGRGRPCGQRASRTCRSGSRTSDPVEVVRDVLAQRIDVGVADRTGPDADDRLTVESVPSHPIVLACRPDHPLTKVPRPTPAQVMSFPLVTTLLRGAAAATALFPSATTPRTGSTTGDFVPQLSVNSLSLARLIARQSNALFPGTAGMLAEDIAAGHLVLLDFRVPAMQTNYGVIYLRGRTLAPAARAFIAALHAVEAEAQIASATPLARGPKGTPGKRQVRSGLEVTMRLAVELPGQYLAMHADHFGEHQGLVCGARGGGNCRLPLARSAAYLGQLARSGEHTIRAAGDGGLGESGDGAAVCAPRCGPFGALCGTPLCGTSRGVVASRHVYGTGLKTTRACIAASP